MTSAVTVELPRRSATMSSAAPSLVHDVFHVFQYQRKLTVSVPDGHFDVTGLIL